jgi:TolB-like protein
VRGHGYRFAMAIEEVADQDDEPQPKLALPDKPSLVVLPFVNLSSDPAQEYFSDGITEDIITELSRFRSLFVIGRQSAFSFKGRNLTTREIAEQLGVSYVVDGSLQRSGDRIRFNIRLVDASDDAQLWAERYDREIEDILVVQEDVARTVAATIGGRVEATRGRQRIDKTALESYDCLLQAQALYYDFAKESNAMARELLERAIEIDPDNARALAILAAVHSMDSWSFWVDDNERSRRLSLELGRRSVELDDTDSLAQALFAEILFDCDQPELAEHHFRRAIALNPNDIAARALYASKLRSTGCIDEAIEHITIAKRLDPFGLLWIPLIEGSIMFAARRYEDAANALYAMTSPPNEARYILIAALARLGRHEEALRLREEFFRRAREEMPHHPGERLEDWAPVFARMLGNPEAADLDHVLESMRLIGWT